MSVVTTSLGDVLFIPAQWSAPLAERLAWHTDVTKSFDGENEGRVCNMQQPRQRLEGEAPVNGSLFQSSYNLAYGNLDSVMWAMPHWGEVVENEGVDLVNNRVSCDTRFIDLRVGSLVLLWSGACAGGWQLAVVTAIDDTYVELEDEPTVETGLVVPVRLSTMTGYNRTTRGYGASLALSQDATELVDLEGAAPAQFLGEDIYFDEILFSSNGELVEDVGNDVDIMDEDIGIVTIDRRMTDPTMRRPYEQMFDNLEDIWNFRLFLHRRKGRYRAFWSPSFHNDIRVKSTGALTTSFTAYKDDFLLGAGNRVHVAIQKADGSWLARTITNVVSISSTDMTVTLDTSIAMNGSDIVRVCYLGLRRLATDVVTLDWEGGGIVRVSFPTEELTP